MFARGSRPGWTSWGAQAGDDYAPTWATYSHNSAAERGRTGVVPARGD
jgi:hypothetical protein